MAEKNAESDAAWWADGAILALDIFTCFIAHMQLTKESTKLLARLMKITMKNCGPKGSGPAWFKLERTAAHIAFLHDAAPAHSARAEMLSKLKAKVRCLRCLHPPGRTAVVCSAVPWKTARARSARSRALTPPRHSRALPCAFHPSILPFLPSFLPPSRQQVVTLVASAAEQGVASAAITGSGGGGGSSSLARMGTNAEEEKKKAERLRLHAAHRKGQGSTLSTPPAEGWSDPLS